MSDQTTLQFAKSMAIIRIHRSVTLGGGDVELVALVRYVVERGATCILLDLAGVRCIDAAGIGVLVACHNFAASRGIPVRLVAPCRQVRQFFLLTKLHLVFDIFAHVGQALSTLASPIDHSAA